ncbi:MAG: SMP-30/gluconolactonase/LRE family protein [Bacteroidales bacterium]
MKAINLLLVLSLLIITSCKTKTPTEETTEAATEPETKVSLEMLWESDTVFRTPESVLYDADQNILYVSNIDGTPDEKDGNGFISTVGPAGNLIQLEWVTGLNAPKGMGVYQNMLYVTDIDELVVIDITQAAIKEKIPVAGAAFLNDVAVDVNGKVYFSDSGTGKIHIYENGEVKDWITEGLERPNGLFIEEDRVLLTSSGSADLRVIDPETADFEVVTTEIGAGDGVEYTGYEGYYLTSDWSGEVFIINPDFTKESLLRTKDDEINSADIGLNTEDHVVYVPTFFDNRVVAYKIVMN